VTRLVLVLLVFGAFAAGAAEDQSAPSGDEQVWIDLRAPTDAYVQRLPLAMIEVAGSTGAGAFIITTWRS